MQSHRGSFKSDQSSPQKRKSVLMLNKPTAKQLLTIFQSENFTPEMLIHYYIDTFNEPGPHQFLTNKLYYMPTKFVEDYIPQFCYMLIKKGSQSMIGFLEHLCKSSIANYLKIMWSIIAYSEQERLDSKKLKEVEKIERRLETSMVNGAITISKLDILANQDSVDFQIMMQKQFQEKEHRFSYVSLVNRFVINMIKISLTLKSFEIDKRKAQLASQIRMGNKSIKKIRNSHKDLPYYWGIILPFQRKFENEDPSNLMVRIVESDYACFNTKTRVPYRILIETISYKEIAEKETLSTNKQVDASTISDLEEDFLFPNNQEELEYQMKDLTHAKMNDNTFKALQKFENSKCELNSPTLFQKIINFAGLWFITQDQTNEFKNIATYQKKKFMVEFISERGWQQNLKTTDNEFDEDDIDSKKKRLSSDIVRFRMGQQQPSRKTKLIEEINNLENQYFQQAQQGQQRKIYVKVHGPWGEDWDLKLQAIREQSPYQYFESYRIRSIIVKGGDDLRQELMAIQLIQKFDEIFRGNYLNVYLKPYEIIVTSENSGMIEFVPNTLSMDGLKKTLGNKSLNQFFKEYFQDDFPQAQRNFIESLAGYSLVTYLLQIKDRHNGNILVDNQGHLIHIDFGFMLSISPGNMNFEQAPFKFTNDYMELLNGKTSKQFEYFRLLTQKGFNLIRKNCDGIFQIVEILMEKSNFPCFTHFNLQSFKERFKQNATDEECNIYVDQLIENSVTNWRTKQYDYFQKLTNGIAP